MHFPPMARTDEIEKSIKKANFCKGMAYHLKINDRLYIASTHRQTIKKMWESYQTHLNFIFDIVYIHYVKYGYPEEYKRISENYLQVS